MKKKATRLAGRLSWIFDAREGVDATNFPSGAADNREFRAGATEVRVCALIPRRHWRVLLRLILTSNRARAAF
jgi:hypothetical protein